MLLKFVKLYVIYLLPFITFFTVLYLLQFHRDLFCLDILSVKCNTKSFVCKQIQRGDLLGSLNMPGAMCPKSLFSLASNFLFYFFFLSTSPYAQFTRPGLAGLTFMHVLTCSCSHITI